MNADIKRKWVTALRSGEYTQLRHGFHYEGKHCCLAVLGACVSEKVPFPDDAMLGLGERERTMLIRMNDEGGKSFAEIADYIEQNL